jgi:hypothetical protein
MDWKTCNGKVLDEAGRDQMAEKLKNGDCGDFRFILAGGSMVVRYKDNFFDCQLIRVVGGSDFCSRVCLPTIGFQPSVPNRPKLVLVPPSDDR